MYVVRCFVYNISLRRVCPRVASLFRLCVIDIDAERRKQGMNFVALALLEACGGDDENAFWILAGMCENLELEVSFCNEPPLFLCCSLLTQRFEAVGMCYTSCVKCSAFLFAGGWGSVKLPASYDDNFFLGAVLLCPQRLHRMGLPPCRYIPP